MSGKGRACTKCKLLTDDLRNCPTCNSRTTPTWRGMVLIVDPIISQVAQEMKIKRPGSYGLYVKPRE